MTAIIRYNSQLPAMGMHLLLTFNCNFDCAFCCTHFLEEQRHIKWKIQPGKKWVDFINKIPVDKRTSLSLSGGEPTLHPDFYEIIEGVDKDWKNRERFICIQTNLAGPDFDNDCKVFLEKFRGHNYTYIHASYHHEKGFTVEEFLKRVNILRRNGILIPNLYIVKYPGEVENGNFEKDIKAFEKLRVEPEIQYYSGYYKGELYPNKLTKEQIQRTHKIDNLEFYNDGFSRKKKRKVLCSSSQYPIVSPNGNLYNCFYHCYSQKEHVGNVFDDEEILYSSELFNCSDYGFCHPCEYTKIKIFEFDNDEQIVRLNIGCGEKILKGYINLDKRKLKGVDMISDICRIPFGKETVDELLASHVIEHVDIKEGITFIFRSFNMLKKGGKLIIRCPFITETFEAFKAGRMNIEQFNSSIFGIDPKKPESMYQENYHKSGYTVEYLAYLLTNAGFAEVITRTGLEAKRNCEIIIEAIK